MSSDLYMFDESFHQHFTMFNSEETQLLTESDPFSALSDSSIDSILQEFSEEPNTITITEPRISSNLDQFESLSLYQQTHFGNLPNSTDFSGGYVNYPVSAIKTEEFSMGLNSEDCFVGSQSYGCGEESAMMRLMQRNFSHGSHSYEEEKPWPLFQPRFFDALFDSSGFENGFSSIGQMRRVCSTGDLPTVIKSNQVSAQGESSATTLMEEANFKVGRYSAEERKEKIDRYRAKRTQRNFNKTIKYACRKTLADNRPRVRGRFARNDDAGEMLKSAAPCSNAYEDEDDILLYSWHEEEDAEKVRSGGGGAGGSVGGCSAGENEKVDSFYELPK